MLLDAFYAKKIRCRVAERLSFNPILVPGTTPQVDVLARRSVIVAAMTTAKVIDGLPGEGLGGKSGPGDDDLAVFVLESGVGGLKSWHVLVVFVGRRGFYRNGFRWIASSVEAILPAQLQSNRLPQVHKR